jgi:protein O-GlcNAc transferase
VCYQPPKGLPLDFQLEDSTSRPITFGCFNGMQKLSNSTIDLFAGVLRAVPASRLMLKNSSLGDATVCQEIRQRFAGSAIDPGRVVLCPRDPSTLEHLGRYREVDIALDTYPYHGTTTTCEALWMGVPVVTLAGSSHCSRVGASVLSAVGLQEMVAEDASGFVRIASSLASDSALRTIMREEIRSRVRRSALTDACGFTRRLEEAYRHMWKVMNDNC